MSINQIGIIFNFLAGFLLAPDIFGEDKLIGWENTVKNTLHRMERALTKMFLRFVSSDGERPQYRFFALFAGALTLFLLCVLITLWREPYILLSASPSTSTFLQNVLQDRYSNEFSDFAWIFLIIGVLSALFMYREYIWHVKGKAKVNVPILIGLLFFFSLSILSIFNRSLSYLLLTIAGTLLFSFPILGLLLILLIGVSGIMLDFLIGSISRKEGIKGTFTTLGVLSFVIGNLLQFFAG